MGEQQYLDLVRDVLDDGEVVNGRNGKTVVVFGRQMRFKLNNNALPVLTTKKMAWKTCIKELLWFISGNTDNTVLKTQNVKIWNDNGSREYLDSIGLVDRDEDDLGPVYGHQWRHFNAPYSTCQDDYSGEGVDQLQGVIDALLDETQRYSRRLILCAWNPSQLSEMALPPCHVLAHFNVINNRLSCALYQRSCDVGLGVPFNIMSYSVLTHLLAHHCGLDVGEFVYFMGNVHIYDDHIEALKEQSTRECFPVPTLEIKQKHSDIKAYTIDDFTLHHYCSHSSIHMTMRK